jgi:hypothetical protein
LLYRLALYPSTDGICKFPIASSYTVLVQSNKVQRTDELYSSNQSFSQAITVLIQVG